MDRNDVAKSLLKIARELTAGPEGKITMDEYEKYAKKGLSGLKALAKEYKGKVKSWKLGDGWKVVIDLNVMVQIPNAGFFSNETSEGCIIYATTQLLKQLGVSPKKVFDSDELKDVDMWKPLCKIPSKWTKKDAYLLADDLTDVNYHSEAGKLSNVIDDAVEKAKIARELIASGSREARETYSKLTDQDIYKLYEKTNSAAAVLTAMVKFLKPTESVSPEKKQVNKILLAAANKIKSIETKD